MRDLEETRHLLEDFSRTMMLLHRKKWREIKNIKSENTTWLDTFLVLLQTDQCPLFVKADVQRAKRYMVDPAKQESDSSYEDSDVPTTQMDSPRCRF